MARGAVVITGASTGIGRGCARDLAQNGFRVFAGVRKEEDAESIRADGIDGLEPITIDVTDSESITAARETVATALGDEGLAGLVNNAGVGSIGPMEYFPLRDVRWMFDVNYFGVIETTQAFLPLLKKERGRIVLMSSIAGRLAAPFNGPYASTKFALEAYGDALRTELKPWGVQVTSIEPGLVDTPLIDKLAWFWGSWDAATAPEEVQADYQEALEAMVVATDKLTKNAIPVDGVSKAVRKALTARRPKTRQTVGRDAWFSDRVLRRLPDRWSDALMRRFVGLPG